jgi:hypothetical protein
MGGSVRLFLSCVVLSLTGCGNYQDRISEARQAEPLVLPGSASQVDDHLTVEEAEALLALGYVEPEPAPQLLIISADRRSERRSRRAARNPAPVLYAGGGPTQEQDLFLANDGVAQDTDEKKSEPDPDIIEAVERATDAKEHVDVQEDVIDEAVEGADELNDELADIIEKLREQKGLPKAAPYEAPTEALAQQQLDEEMRRQQKPKLPTLPPESPINLPPLPNLDQLALEIEKELEDGLQDASHEIIEEAAAEEPDGEPEEK